MTLSAHEHASAKPTLNFANYRFAEFFPPDLYEVWGILDSMFQEKKPFVVLGREARIVIGALQKHFLNYPIVRGSQGRSPYMVVFRPEGEIRYKLDIYVPGPQRGSIIGELGRTFRPIQQALRTRDITAEVHTFKGWPDHIHVWQTAPETYQVEVVRVQTEESWSKIDNTHIITSDSSYPQAENVIFAHTLQARTVAELYADAYFLEYLLPVAWE